MRSLFTSVQDAAPSIFTVICGNQPVSWVCVKLHAIADAVTGTTSRRWAWGARHLISTQWWTGTRAPAVYQNCYHHAARTHHLLRRRRRTTPSSPSPFSATAGSRGRPA